MLNTVKKYQNLFLKSFNTSYRRYLFDQIDFDDKMIAIFGTRGTGNKAPLWLFGFLY